MDKLSFFRIFHVALAVLCLLLHRPICVAHKTVEYFEAQYLDGIRYSKLFVVLQIFILLQSAFALEEVLHTFFLSQGELELVPDPDLRLLSDRFLGRFYVRNARMISTVCCYLFLEEWYAKYRDGDGTAFVVVLIALSICEIVLNYTS